MLGLFSLVLLPGAALAAPLSLGISFGAGSNNLPTLTLPYATIQAYSYDVTDDYYVFKNIPFAAPPIGDRRWKKPEPPLTQTGILNGTVGNQCPQALPENLSFGYPFLAALEPWSEDCLFLDIQVPGSAVRGEVENLPVLVWIFGGGYVLGSKSFFLYDGHPLLDSGANKFIWVAPNYRLGAFGFLNGPTVQAQGVPNVAFWDQRAAFQWVQDYIYLLKGDKNTVTAMGESAGAGSIMHHLVANEGALAPNFHRAILQSPAFEPKSDQAALETQYKLFEKTAGCEGKGLTCLRTKTTDQLQTANLAVVGAAQYGTFGFGPAVDNQLITDLPAILMTKGKFWPNVQVIVGHTQNEGYIFADPNQNTDSKIKALIKANMPYMTTATESTLWSLYPSPSLLTDYSTTFGRLSAVIGDWVVNCNSRAVATAYAGKSWSYVFNVPPGIHAIDLIFTFWRTDLNIYNLFQLDFEFPFITKKNLATGWQSYLTSFVRSGNPNTYRESGGLPATRDFPLSTIGKYVKGLEVQLMGFSVDDDKMGAQAQCAFWNGGAWTGR